MEFLHLIDPPGKISLGGMKIFSKSYGTLLKQSVADKLDNEIQLARRGHFEVQTIMTSAA